MKPSALAVLRLIVSSNLTRRGALLATPLADSPPRNNLNSRASQVRSAGEGEEMRWWIKALIFSVISSVIVFGVVGGVGILHTEVFLAGQITPAQDQAFAEAYGDVATFGIVAAWVICFIVFYRRRGARDLVVEQKAAFPAAGQALPQVGSAGQPAGTDPHYLTKVMITVTVIMLTVLISFFVKSVTEDMSGSEALPYHFMTMAVVGLMFVAA